MIHSLFCLSRLVYLIDILIPKHHVKMFVKPFKVKSNAAIRGSDRKRLRNALQKEFNSIDESIASSIIPNKEEVIVVKIYSHKGNNATAYFMNKNPILFEVGKALYPTLYFLWQYPKLVPSLTTHRPVIAKLANGADLMLPGVVLPLNENALSFNKGSIVAVNAEGNMSAVAVGVTLMSSHEIVNSTERKGKAVEILHVFGDHLWDAGERLQLPHVDPSTANLPNLCDEPEQSNEKDYSKCVEDAKSMLDKSNDISEVEALENLSLEDSKQMEIQDLPPEQNATSELVCSALEDAINDIADEVKDNDDMDELLHLCFMTALKTKLKDNELPILASSFYRMKVLPCCPDGKFLDIKKTSFKKLNKYLKSISETGLIQVKELTKGNDNIVFVDRSHEELRSFKPEVKCDDTETDIASNTQSQFGVITQKEYEPPQISILHGVNNHTLPLFNALGYSKGTAMLPADIRKVVTDYVKENELVDGRLITLDPLLHDTLYNHSNPSITKLSWEELFKILLSRMQVYHQLKFQGAPAILKKGAPPKIEITTQRRSGNKKVTLVKNLECFLIDPQEFADRIRKIAQASTSVTLLPGSNPNQPMHQVLVQGNQVGAVDAILTGQSYKIHRNYLLGLELIPKKGKHKK